MATISISRVVIQHKTKQKSEHFDQEFSLYYDVIFSIPKSRYQLITHDFYKQKTITKMFRLKL